MRSSAHLARAAAAGQADEEDCRAARRLDPLLAVLCCLLDVCGFAVGGSLSGAALSGAGLSGTGLSGGAAGAPALGAAVLAALAVPALTWRCRAPRLVFGGIWLHGLVSALLLGFRPVAALALALYTLTVRVRRGVALAALSVSLVPAALGALAVPASGTRPVAALGGAATVLTGAWLAGQRAHLRCRRRTLRQRLAREAEHREALDAERSTTTHELLDILTHCLSAILMQAAGARRVLACDPNRAAKALATIETSGIQATGELYRLLGVLRASGLAQVSAIDLAVARPQTSPACTAPASTVAGGSRGSDGSSGPVGSAGPPAPPPPAAPAATAASPGLPALQLPSMPAGQPPPGTAPLTPVPGFANETAEPGGASEHARRRLSLSDLRPFLEQARAAGVPLRVVPHGERPGQACGLELPTGLPSDPAADPASGTVEMRWADGALELLVAAVPGPTRDRVPAPRSTWRQPTLSESA